MEGGEIVRLQDRLEATTSTAEFDAVLNNTAGLVEQLVAEEDGDAGCPVAIAISTIHFNKWPHLLVGEWWHRTNLLDRVKAQ